MPKQPTQNPPSPQGQIVNFCEKYKKRIETHKKSVYAFRAFAKSKAERRNSNCLLMANNNTPLACFFICSFRTPTQIELSSDRLFSMVACSGKGSPFAVFHKLQFSTPLHVTAQSVETLAVTSANKLMELSAMIYTFLALPRETLARQLQANPSATKFKLKAQAESRQQARYMLSQVYARQYLLFWIGQANESAATSAKNCPNLTACSSAKGGLYA